MKPIVGVLFALVVVFVPAFATAQICNSSSPCTTTSNWGSGPAIEIDQGSSNNAPGLSSNITNGSGIAIKGQSTSGIAIEGQATSSGTGIYGIGSTGIGVHGHSDYVDGIYGDSYGTNGVEGYTGASGASGVYGHSDSPHSFGVAGVGTGYAIGVYGDGNNSLGWSGWFNTRVNILNGLQVAGVCIAGNCTSDANMKKNIAPLTGSLDKLVQLQPVSFEWKETGGQTGLLPGTQVGLIAQDVEKVMPSWVSTNDQGVKQVNRDALPIMMLDSIKTLKSDNDALRTQLRTFEWFSLFVGFGLIGWVVIRTRKSV